jgi:hypothetical protein
MMEMFEADLDLKKTSDQIRLMIEKYAAARTAPQSSLDGSMNLSIGSQGVRSMQAPGASEVMGTRTVKFRRQGTAQQ